MKIDAVMSKNPKFCVPGDKAPKAARLMKDMDVGIVPIIESEQTRRLAGVVTDRDLCLDIVASDRTPHDVRVEECMTDEVISCRPDDDIKKALDLMRENLVRRIPVVDENHALQGMVSMADLVRRGTLEAHKTHDALRKISEPSTEASKPRARSRKRSAA